MSKNSFKNFSLLFIIILVLLVIGLPLVFVLAAGAGWGGGIQNPLKADTFTKLFVGIANWVAGIVSTLAVLMVVVGGIQYMISGGNEEKVASARRTIQWALIGLIVVLGSWGLLRALLEILGITVT